jgi:5-methylthioadenosine/S-adenosylhomocysteine deaminase
MGLAADIGSLATGKKCDLVAFDFRRPHLVPAVNPAGTLVHTGQGRDVELVMVDGAVVVEDGRPMRADLDTILREGQAAADALWARARGG